MHIPDGFLDPTIVLITYILLIGFILIDYKPLQTNLNRENTSLVTVLAATIFVSQLINWPLPGGTSLHFVGGALTGILLGPHLGFLTMFLVVFIQALVFHDGGITTLAANTINMAIVDVLTGYYIYRLIMRLFGDIRRARIVGALLGGWAGITLAGLACGIEIGYSRYFGFTIYTTVPIMVVWHGILGVIEGIITALTVEYLHDRILTNNSIRFVG